MKRLSIIVPTCDEASTIASLIESIPLQRSDIEVLVVDGGSADDTLSIVKRYPVRLLTTKAGRGRQLAKGVSESSGDTLWFLHADSLIDESHIDAILNIMSNLQVSGGNFAIEFDGDDDFSRWLNRFYCWIRARGIYYGDSGIFIRREILEKIGGIEKRSLMEDYSLVRRLEKMSSKFGIETACIATPKIVTSSRRFRGRKKANIIFGWILIHLLYYLRLPDRSLAAAYNSRLLSGK